MHKQGKAMMIKLRNFVQILQVSPVSSAACEQGFSQMNLHHTAVRNHLAVTTLSDLLIISINGPCLRVWNVDKYVLSWWKLGEMALWTSLRANRVAQRSLMRGRKLLSYLLIIRDHSFFLSTNFRCILLCNAIVNKVYTAKQLLASHLKLNGYRPTYVVF